jgi:hypothetical protein
MYVPLSWMSADSRVGVVDTVRGGEGIVPPDVHAATVVIGPPDQRHILQGTWPTQNTHTPPSRPGPASKAYELRYPALVIQYMSYFII